MQQDTSNNKCFSAIYSKLRRDPIIIQLLYAIRASTGFEAEVLLSVEGTRVFRVATTRLGYADRPRQLSASETALVAPKDANHEARPFERSLERVLSPNKNAKIKPAPIEHPFDSETQDKIDPLLPQHLTEPMRCISTGGSTSVEIRIQKTLESAAAFTSTYLTSNQDAELTEELDVADATSGKVSKCTHAFLTVDSETVSPQQMRSFASAIRARIIDLIETEKPESFFKSMLERVEDTILLIDSESFEIRYASYGLTAQLGYSPSEVVGNNIADYLHPDDLPLALDSVTRQRIGLDVWTLHLRILHKNGSYRVLSANSSDESKNPDLNGILVTLRFGERTRSHQTAIMRKQFAVESLVEELDDGVLICDEHGAISFANAAIREMFTIEESVTPVSLRLSDFVLKDHQGNPRHPKKMLDPHSTAAESFEGTVGVGSARLSLEVSTRSIENHTGEFIGSLVVFHDVTEEKSEQRRLRNQALHDQLTGLPNRRMLEGVLEDFTNLQATENIAACFIDLDSFKMINDTHGHKIGDAVIRMAAKRISSAVRDGDLMARQGGDEFVALLTHVSDEQIAYRRANDILRSLRTPFMVDGLRFDVTASVGVALHTADSVDSDSLLQRADIAMYEAKRQGRNRVVLFDESLQEDSRLRQKHRQLLQTAINENTISVDYEPIFGARSGTLIAFEAVPYLVRSNGEQLYISDMHASVLKTALMADLDVISLDQAFYAATQLCDDVRLTRVAVNLSEASLSQPDFSEILDALIAKHSVKHQHLVIEVTEVGVAAMSPSCFEWFSRFHEEGGLITLDNFGSGLVTLAYIDELAVSCIKIEPGLIAAVHRGSPGSAIVKALSGLAQERNMWSVADGVTTSEQFETLSEIGFDMVQGPFLSPPIPLAACLKLRETENWFAAGDDNGAWIAPAIDEVVKFSLSSDATQQEIDEAFERAREAHRGSEKTGVKAFDSQKDSENL